MPTFNGAYQRLWLSRTITYLGDAGMPVTLSLAAIKVGGGPKGLGAVLGALALARVLSSVPAGIIADRWGRKRVLVASDGLLVCLQTTTGLLLVQDKLPISALLASGVAYGVLSSAQQPSLVGLVAQTIDKPLLARGNARLSLSSSVARLVGPGLAGVVAEAWSPGWYYLADAGSSTLAMVLLLSTQATNQRNRGARIEGCLDGVLRGYRQARMRPWYFRSLMAHAVGNLAFTATLVLGPVVATRKLGGPAAWGLIATGAAVGSVVGGLIVDRLTVRRPLVYGNLACGLAALETLALARPLPLVVVALAAGMGALGIVYVNQTWNTLMQTTLPAELISTLSSFDWAVSLATVPIGMWLAGILAATFSISHILFLSGLVGIIAALVGGLMRSVRALDIAADEVRAPDAISVP